MPYYIRSKTKTYRCKNILDDGTVCGKEFESTQRSEKSAKYCPECRKTKPWGRPHVKRL